MGLTFQAASSLLFIRSVMLFVCVASCCVFVALSSTPAFVCLCLLLLSLCSAFSHHTRFPGRTDGLHHRIQSPCLFLSCWFHCFHSSFLQRCSSISHWGGRLVCIIFPSGGIVYEIEITFHHIVCSYNQLQYSVLCLYERL